MVEFGKVKKYTDVRPGFCVLHDLRNQVEDLLSLITALAEGEDIGQRATDLHVASYQFLEDVTKAVDQEDQ